MKKFSPSDSKHIAEYEVYTLKRGKEGEKRLEVLNGIYNQDSEAFLLNNSIKSVKSILDVGCGTGQMACWVAKTNRNSHVTCIDISAEQIAIAKQRAEKFGLTNISFYCLSIYELEKLNQKFDFVYTRFVLAHLAEPVKALQLMYAVVKSGGILACEEAKTSAHYCYPDNNAFNRYYEIWCEIRYKTGADPELGTKLEQYYLQLGLTNTKSQLLTKDLPVNSELRTIFILNLKEIGKKAIDLGLTSENELSELNRQLEDLIKREDVILRFSGSVQTVGIKKSLEGVSRGRRRDNSPLP